MKTYQIKKVSDSPIWGDIPYINIDVPYLETPESITAKAQICYNEDELLVHLSTVEENIRAVEKGPTGAPYEDSCLEFFFSPAENDIRYFNIEINFNKCMFLGYGSNVNSLVRLLPEPSIESIFEPTVKKTDDGWEVFYRVPYSFIRRFYPDFKVYSGKKMRANCYKCADFSEPPHYLSWSRVEGEPLSFHRPEFFGTMVFE